MNPVRDGIILAVYELIIIIVYIVISGPFVTLVDAIGAADASMTQLQTGVSTSKTVFGLACAIAGLIPLIWFVFRVFSREPDWGYRYY